MASSIEQSAFSSDQPNRTIVAFTNGSGEAKKIDVQRSLSELSSDANLDSVFTDSRDRNDFIFACPRVPLAPIYFGFEFDPNVYNSNFTDRQPLQFAYQNVYKDGSVSALSPYSDLAIPPTILSLGKASLGEKNVENICNLTIPAQGSEVKFVNLVFREGNDGVPFLFDKVPNASGSQNVNYAFVGSGQVMGVYSFKNDRTGVILNDTDRFKTFDNLPRSPKAQEVADDRLIYGNYKEGYPSVDVSASLTVQLQDAPAPGYSFDITAVPYLFRERATTDYGGNEALRSNAGFVIDYSNCPQEILPGVYTLNVLVNPTQNFHAYIGAGDINWHPENSDVTSWDGDLDANASFSTLTGSNGSYVKKRSEIGQIDPTGGLTYTTNNLAYNTGTYVPGGTPPMNWSNESADFEAKTGLSAVSPVIIKGAPIQFRASIEVTAETTKSTLEDSFAHILYGLPFDQAPISIESAGNILFPSAPIDAANVEVSVDLGLADEDFFLHETGDKSDLICRIPGGQAIGGFYIINRAKMRFFLETGNNCFGVTAGKVEFNDQGSLSGGWGMKLCLAHIVDIDVKSCIPTPENNFGSYISPDINSNGEYLAGIESLTGANSPEIGFVNASKVRRTNAAGTSRYDYFLDASSSKRLCWPDQRVQFCPDLAGGTDLYGPAGRASLVAAGSGYTFNSPESWAQLSEVPTDSAGTFNDNFLPAPIRGWYVFDSLKNRYSDDQWADNFGLELAYDVVGADNGNADAAALRIVGNPSTFLGLGAGSHSASWVGELTDHSFTDGGQNYSKICLNRGYDTPDNTANSINQLFGKEQNKISLVDGSVGPGGLDGYANKIFKEGDTKFEYVGSSTDGYQGLKNRDVKSRNTKGSVTNFTLLGYVDNMPFLLNNETYFRSYRQGASFSAPPILDSQFADIVTDSGQSSLYMSLVPQGYQDVDNYTGGYSYGESYDITEDFVPATNNTSVPPEESIIDVSASNYDVIYPAVTTTVPNATFWPKKIVRQNPPLSAGGGMNTPLFSISSNIGVLGGNSFKSSASHEFGIVYFDERGRHGSVQPLGSVYVPGYSIQERPSNQTGSATIQLSINSAPPSWAKSYKIVYGGNNSVSEFIQYSTSQAFLEKGENASADQSRIYVPLHYLQSSEISYAEAYGAVSQDDGTKFLYRHAPGDVLTIIQYSNTDGSVVMPPKPYKFRVVEVVTLDPDMENHPLFPDDVDASTDIRRQGEFLVLENNTLAEGFSVADIQAEASRWKNRVIFEIARPSSQLTDQSRPYYETQYGGQITTGGSHQFSTITMSKGDVYFRQVPVNANPLQGSAFTSNLLGPVDNPTRLKSNFITYFLETEGSTDLYKSNAKPFGRTHFIDPNASEFSRISSMSFSEKTFTGSSDVNYFSFPQTGNFKDLPQDNGEIQKLYSDNVLLTCYQSSKISLVPVSRDVLETGGDEMIVKSSKVLGTPTELKTSYSIYGHPESVLVIDGDHYFFDKRAKKIVMLKGGKQPIVISDIKVDSYVRKVTDYWLDDEWKAILGHDAENDELVFCLVTNGDLNTDGVSSQFGSLAFDLKSKKYWKTRYSYISQFFSKLGGKLVSGWIKPNTVEIHPYINDSGANKNTFLGQSQKATSFKAVANQAPDSVKEFVMVNSVSDLVVDATIETDQTQVPAPFKIWKDYDGVKYAEVPRKPLNPTDLSLTQKLTWTPTYPTLTGSYPNSNVEFKKESDGETYVYVAMFVPLENPLWRNPIPLGKKTVVLERTGQFSDYHECGNHPDSNIVFDRGAFLKDSYKVSSTHGALVFGMKWSNFLNQVDNVNNDWLSDINPPDAVATADFRIQIFDLMAKVIAEGPFDGTGNLSGTTPYVIDINDDVYTSTEKANLARLFIVPILSCTKISEISVEAMVTGEVPKIALPPVVPGDVTGDGNVTTEDLLLVLSEFGTVSAADVGDVNGDGSVTTADILELLSSFGYVFTPGCTDPLATNYDPAADFDDGTCQYPGEETGDGGEPVEVNGWWLANQSQNKQVFIGYQNQLDGVPMKGKHATIEITSLPFNDGSNLNLESLLIDFNQLNKSAGKVALNQAKRKKK